MGISPDQRASYNNPCPICGGITRCLRYTGSGKFVLCQNPPDHLKRDSWRKPSATFNTDFWLIPMSYIGRSPVQTGTQTDSSEPIEPWHNYPAAHQEFLRRLPLSQYWKDDLLRRGFTEEQITERGYRSTPDADGLMDICDLLYERYHTYWTSIPGFDLDPEGYPYLVTGTFRLVIPIRDHHGQIVGMQMRKRTGEPKYAWFSKHGLGGSPYHHNGTGSMALLTEGPLKADLAHYRLGWRTISYQGVSCLGKLGDEMKKIPEVRRVLVANDSDLLTNKSVYIATCNAVDMLADRGLDVALVMWDTHSVHGKPEPKGIDDWLVKPRGPLYKVPIEALDTYPIQIPSKEVIDVP